MLNKDSLLVGLTAPSGTGKTHMTDAIMGRWPEFKRPVVATTREPRPGYSEPHRNFMTEDEFTHAVISGDVVLPHRPFLDDDTPQYGFVTETLHLGRLMVTEVHTSILRPFRRLVTDRRVVLVGMLASGDTLARNIEDRDGTVDGEESYRIRSREAEVGLIQEAAHIGLLDMVVSYEPWERTASEQRVLDFLGSHIERLEL